MHDILIYDKNKIWKKKIVKKLLNNKNNSNKHNQNPLDILIKNIKKEENLK
jgi:hypothetical protein